MYWCASDGGFDPLSLSALSLSLPSSPRFKGTAVGMYEPDGGSNDRQAWSFNPDMSIRLSNNTHLCLTQFGMTATGNPDVVVTLCGQPLPANQQWQWKAANGSQLVCGLGNCLDIQHQNTTRGSRGNVETFACHAPGHDKANQLFSWVSSNGRIVNPATGDVVMAC